MAGLAFRIFHSTLSKLGFWDSFAQTYLRDGRRLRSIPRNGKCLFQVVGVPRSGTTVMAAKLSNHPRIICLNEPYLIWQRKGEMAMTPAQQARGLPARVRGKTPQGLLRELCENPELQFIGFKETFRIRQPHGHYPNDQFLQAIDRAKAVDKTIAIVRNPKDVWNSHRKKQLKSKPGASVQLTTAFTDNWNAYARWVRDGRLFVLKYEDMVADPHREFIRMTDYLGAAFLPEMLDGMAAESAGDAPKPHERALFTTSVGGNLHDLREEEHRLISGQCGEGMAHFGYG